MTDRKRDPLPEGYQFGDAGKTFVFGDLYLVETDPKAVTRSYRSTFMTANVIEGDHFTTDRDPGDEA